MCALRILIADDHEVFRRGTQTLLESHQGWKVCAEAASGREAVEKAKQLKPDVVVMDISMPELNGLEAAEQILKVAPKTEVLILTIHDSEELVREMTKVGVRGYLLKTDTSQDLIAAVEALAHHKPFFTSKAADVILQEYRRLKREADQTTGAGRLSAREKEVVQLLAEGRSNKEVATALGISVRTVETHRSNIMRKLNLGSISDLVRYAVRNKIVTA
jgi:DNA-binding NarL/FixJ family response regulator